MTEREGVIQFELLYRFGSAPDSVRLHDLDGWRSILFRLRLIGRDPLRYGGLGFGNVSMRTAGGFVVSGSQTGDRPSLGADGYCRVTRCEPEANRICAIGPIKPSSEAMTHGAVYRASASAQCVLHGHSPELWHAASTLGLAVTDPAVPYGTPAMAREVARLCTGQLDTDRAVFVMGGHEDGVIAFGPDVASTGALLVATLAQALAAAN